MFPPTETSWPTPTNITTESGFFKKKKKSLKSLSFSLGVS